MTNKQLERLKFLHSVFMSSYLFTPVQLAAYKREYDAICIAQHGSNWFDDAAQPSDPITHCNPDYMTRDCDSGL